jgi:hypothetical protein
MINGYYLPTSGGPTVPATGVRCYSLGYSTNFTEVAATGDIPQSPDDIGCQPYYDSASSRIIHLNNKGVYSLTLGPMISLVKAVKPSFNALAPGTNYQLQVSADLNTWTNQGSPFTATNTSMVYPQYWDVDNWSQLFFRLQLSP